MIERETELAVADCALDAAARQHGCVLVIEGAPGIGKSELCAAISRLAAGRGFGTLWARGGEFERDVSFGVVRQLFERLIRDAGDEQRAHLLSGPAQLAAALVGVSGAAQPISADTGAEHGLYWLVANLTARQPTLLVLDDAQWADPESARFLLYLARRIEGSAAVLALAVRSGVTGASRELLDRIALEPTAQRIELGPLSAAGTTQLVSEQAGRTLPAPLTAACHAVSGGVPFYLTQIAASLPVDADDEVLVEHVRSQVPSAVRHSILLRLGRLGAHTRAVADALAVLGPSTAHTTLAAVAGIGEADAVQALEQLAHAGIAAHSGPISFAHPIIRNAVYEQISSARRRTLHSKAAGVLRGRAAPDDEVAHHLLYAEPAGMPDAVDVLRRAAATAARHGGYASAVALLCRALAEPPQPEIRATVLAELGQAELAADDPAAAVDHLRAALAAGPPPSDSTNAAVDLGRALAAVGDSIGATAELLAAAQRADGDNRLRLQVERTALAQFIPELLAGARQDMARYGTFEGSTTTERAALAMAALARAFDPVAHVSDALPLARRALAGGALVTEVTCEAPEAGNAAYVLNFAEEADEFRSIFEVFFADARSRGSAFGFLTASLGASMLAVQEGRLASAIAHAEASLAMWPDVRQTPQAKRWASTSVRFLAEGLVSTGRLLQARELLEQWSVEDVNTPVLVMVRYGRGLLHQAMGEHAAALADFIAYGEFSALLGYEDRTTPWRLGAARAATALGHHGRAVELADQALAIARTWGTPGGIGLAQHVRAELSEPAEAQTRLLDAVAALRRSPCRLGLAEALVALGLAQRRAGDRTAARDTLVEGLDLAAECGATPLADRARVELNVLGARPRRDRSTGRNALTPSEARIAALAADGRTNREIAQHLFVTPKTVELHLTNVYRKLQIGSRADLSEVLA